MSVACLDMPPASRAKVGRHFPLGFFLMEISCATETGGRQGQRFGYRQKTFGDARADLLLLHSLWRRKTCIIF